MVGGDVDLFAAGGGEFGAGFIHILRGPDAGKTVGYLDRGVGGGLDLSIGVEGGVIFYTGDVKNFQIELLQGDRNEYSAATPILGVNGFISSTPNPIDGGKVIGIMGTYGPGINPLNLFGIAVPFMFNFNYGSTKIYNSK